MPSSSPASSARRQPLTPRLAWLLAGPHTWPASIVPVLVATAAAYHATGSVPVPMCLVLLAIAILMQSSVNVFNDYFDCVRGADSAEDNVEEDDAVLVYNDVSPRSACALAVGLLVVAFGLGTYVIVHAGLIPLAIALVGAAAVVLYSGGRTPLSYLPVGEVVSGVVMGGLITLACYQALTGTFSWLPLAWGIPPIIGIGLIMMTNNACDIEKDLAARRRTLPVLIGRNRTVVLYRTLLVVWVVAIAAIVVAWFRPGWVVVVFMVLCCQPLVRALAKNPLLPSSRVGAMGQVCSVNVALGAFYAFAIAL